MKTTPAGKLPMRDVLKKAVRMTPLKITLFVIAGMLVFFLFDFQFLRFVELKALDIRMLSRGELKPGPETVIAAVDEQSVAELGRWPWPRTLIARLIDRLKADGAKAIGFDIIFSEPALSDQLQTLDALQRELQKDGAVPPRIAKFLTDRRAAADTDAILAASIEKAQNVTLGYFFHFAGSKEKALSHVTPQKIQASLPLIENSRYAMINSTGPVPDDSFLPRAFAPEVNIPAISRAGVNSGYFNMLPDRDGSNRRAPLVIACRDNYYASLAVSLVQSYLGFPPLALDLEPYGVKSVRIGDLSIPADESGRLLINYLGRAHTFPHYSIADILAGKTAPGTFRDKIVLIGATAAGTYDLRVTPFSSSYPGIEIHATVIDNILHRHFLYHSTVTRFIDVCTIVFLGLLIGFLIPRLSPIAGMLAAFGLIGAYVAANFLIFFRFNVWLNLVFPFITMVLIYLGITIYHYVQEEKEKRKIRGAFQYYLNASVINEMLKDPAKLKLGGDKKDLSVMFSDIRGFTTLSEKLSPQELVSLLNEYLTAMTRQVFKYDGLLDKYIGDAIMAVFGAPLSQPDHARRACLTALDMIKELDALQGKWKSEGRPEIHIGIGINSGEMVVGNMGSDMRFDYTVMGDMVNLASRLEGTNKEYGTCIIISEFTYEAVKNDMCCRELDFVRVKGKVKPVRIYELLGEKKDEAKHKDMMEAFAEALSLYREGKFNDAISAFLKVLDIRPGDPVSLMFMERCMNLKENPPLLPWDGVFVMMKK
jgi:adenylate cyclase